MAPIPERALKAINAMRVYGFSGHTTKPVLKDLLKVFDYNWDYIEADGYQVLVDALLEQQDSAGKAGESEIHKPADDPEVINDYNSPEHGKRKSRARDEELHVSASLPSSSLNSDPGKRIKLDAGTFSGHVLRKRGGPVMYEDETCHDTSVVFEAPLAVMWPQSPSHMGNEVVDHQAKKDDSFYVSPSIVNGAAMPLVKERLDGNRSSLVSGNNQPAKSDIAKSQEASSIVDTAASDCGEVKLMFSYTSTQPNFNMPNMDDVIRSVEAKCLNAYKVIEPSFNIRSLLKQMCQTFLELGSETAEENKNPVNAVQSNKKSVMPDALGGIPSCSNPPIGLHIPKTSGVNTEHNASGINGDGGTSKMKGPENQETSNGLPSGPVIPHQSHLAIRELRPLHDQNDISKGEERVRISLVNEVNRETCPSYFNYIPRNIVFQNAHVNFSLARIGDEDCCPDCFLNCLAAPLPCSCALETGGEFAYTSDGLLKRSFLDECFSKNFNPENHNLFVCKDCPLERAKNENSAGTCKGHVKRKFIKECWSKCGCSKECGNRVVQRGITCNLQVFMTSEGKGWGLRTCEELPKGAFVCEYVGEVLTNAELYERTMRTAGKARHPRPVLLDADWGSRGTMKDEEALCLDATFFGNVARFINHRCHDANLIEVPVQVETPDHHYYHIAFFTTRKVEPFEELTWDYGIDFDDDKHNAKVFKCRCDSRYCRNRKRLKAKNTSFRMS